MFAGLFEIFDVVAVRLVSDSDAVVCNIGVGPVDFAGFLIIGFASFECVPSCQFFELNSHECSFP